MLEKIFLNNNFPYQGIASATPIIPTRSPLRGWAWTLNHLFQTYAVKHLPESYCRYYRKPCHRAVHVGSSPSIRPRTGAFVICVPLPQNGIVESAMTHFPQAHANLRSPRVQLNGSV